MSYAHRELNRINRAMSEWQPTETLVRLRIARETIEWMLDPQAHIAPSDGIRIQEGRDSVKHFARYALSDANHGR